MLSSTDFAIATCTLSGGGLAQVKKFIGILIGM